MRRWKGQEMQNTYTVKIEHFQSLITYAQTANNDLAFALIFVRWPKLSNRKLVAVSGSHTFPSFSLTLTRSLLRLFIQETQNFSLKSAFAHIENRIDHHN